MAGVRDVDMTPRLADELTGYLNTRNDHRPNEHGRCNGHACLIQKTPPCRVSQRAVRGSISRRSWRCLCRSWLREVGWVGVGRREVDERVGEAGGRGCERKRVEDKDQVPGPLGTREGVEVGDVGDRGRPGGRGRVTIRARRDMPRATDRVAITLRDAHGARRTIRLRLRT